MDEDEQEEVIYLDEVEEVEEVSVEEIFGDLDISVDDEPECQPEIIDLSVLTFPKHEKSIFCSDLTIDGKFAITGGEDDTAYLWNTENGEVVFECTGHKDSVIQVCFNSNDQYVATGDMKGIIQVWNVGEKTRVWYHEGDQIEWLFWHPVTNVLFCGTSNGEVSVWKIPQGNCKMLSAYNNSPALCAKLLPNGKYFLVGYENGQLKLWFIRECRPLWTTILSGPAYNLDINNEGTLAIVAPGSTVVKLSDGKIITTLLARGETEVEDVLFHKELGTIATGSISGKLCVWELGRHVLKHQANIQCAVTVMKWGSDSKIFVGATDAAVYVCDVRTGSLLHKLTGHKSEILSISVFKNCSNKILTTSDDGTAKIFNINLE